MNKILFKIHRLLALLICVPLLLISVSGSILVFKHELDALLMPERVRVAAHNSERLPLDVLLQAVNKLYPNVEVTGWQMFADPQRADLVYVMAHGGSTWSSMFVDQYQAQVLAAPAPPKFYFTDLVRTFHYQFLVGDAGLLLCAVIAVLLCGQALIGLILHRKFWKVLFRFRHRARPIIYLGDGHKLLGAIASPVLLILGFTGAFWNISQLSYSLAKPASPAAPYIVGERLYDSGLSFDELLADAGQRLPGFRPSFVSLPSKPGYEISVLGEVSGQHPLYSEFANAVRYNAQSGEFTGMRDLRLADTTSQIKNSFRRLHFGDFAGNWSRAIWAILGLSPVLLIATGIVMWRIRRPQRLRQATKQKRTN
ncbi:PepSY-associated TM helix domain-containing protein [Zhongshania sp.]|uniref:PepSY-associated TM helix domain-containing protein n=1 Tax=Zhongshania sp. TaxID=1971902 RepID=UPI00356AA5EE